MADLPPALPTQFQIYDTYTLDPPWQVHYTIAWAGAAALFTLFSLPKLYRNIRSGKTWQSVRGISIDLSFKNYKPVAPVTEKSLPPPSRIAQFTPWLSNCRHFLLWSLPGFGLDLGQLLLLLGYFVILCFCIVFNAPLRDNPNRAGFMTVAQLPFVFLFATKNSVLSLLWHRGYERLNFLHRWAGRGIFLSATIHGAFWIRNHLQYNVPILGATKEQLGVISYALLGIIVLTSLKPVRYYAYGLFFYTHVVAFVSFFVVLNYHTPYSVPWIFPPLAFYGLDIFIRLLRYRIREAELIPHGNLMTIMRVQDCDGGWVAGQHIRVRTFFSGRLFESHPLTIMNAPPSTSCFSDGGIMLGARVNGDWTKAVNGQAREKTDDVARVMVMLDGPYGGSSIDLGEYEKVLLVAGGSGITFTLALLDDLVGRVLSLGRSRDERTKKVEFVWCIRSFGNILWFAPMLNQIATMAKSSSLELNISVFVTCLCDPEAVPDIPNCSVFIEKPSVRQMMKPLMEHGLEDSKGPAKLSYGSGLAVAASGPESLTREARNAVASLSLGDRRRMGKIGIHTEVFAI